MALNCPDCQFPIPYDDINIVKTIAKCKSCNNIFEFTKEREKRGEFPTVLRNELLIIPPGIEVLKLMNELEIMVKWRKSGKFFTLFFALFWNVFVFFFTSIMIFSGEFGVSLFMIPFIAVGIYLLYAGIGYLVNTTYITVDENQLSVEHKPVNFLIQKDKYFTPKEIKQLYVKRYEVGRSNDTPVYAFSVDLILTDRSEFNLVKGLHSVSYARYIEREIENYLKIKDSPMSGEWE
ncbi:MAG: hypothetical protein AB8G15_16515 [Saprospiraceae bacterium]